MKKRILITISLLIITAIYIIISVAANTANGSNLRPERELLTAAAVSREPTVIKYGIDVSRWQGDIDWEAVANTRADFVMMRAAVGGLDGEPVAEDSRFREYIKGASENSLDVGVYMYSYAKTVREIQNEARYLVALLRNCDYDITYPVTLDMEEEIEHYTDKPVEMAEAFMEIIMDAGYFPMFYSYKSWLENYLTDEFRGKYAVWVAELDSPATTYNGNYYMWQYSHTGKVSGIEGDVDLNISYRDFAEYIKQFL